MAKKIFPTLDNWMGHFVSYGETDGMGVLYNAEYLHLFERGRSQFCRDQGMGYGEIEKRGVNLPLRQAHCRYRSPSRYDDKIWVRTGISEWKRASMTFTYEIYNEDRSLLLAEGTTEHACVNAEGKPFRLPQWLIDLFT